MWGFSQLPSVPVPIIQSGLGSVPGRSMDRLDPLGARPEPVLLLLPGLPNMLPL